VAYTGIPAALGTDTPYFALALLNRLEKPWQIMRVAQALDWKRGAKRDTELAAICGRLLRMLTQIAEATSAATRKATALTVTTEDLTELRSLMGRYAETAEALHGVVDFRKDADWAAEIIKSRGKMRVAFAADRLAPLEAVVIGFLVPAPGGEPMLAETAVPRAMEAARLVVSVAHHGGRHGFASDAKVLIAKFGKLFDLHAERLLAKPQGVEQQLQGLVKVVRVLFKDIHAETLAKRVEATLRRLAKPPADANAA
jgi:Glu-tRNA(Gln) amidotransferase subunit E-like FAD-binding protein